MIVLLIEFAFLAFNRCYFNYRDILNVHTIYFLENLFFGKDAIDVF